MSELSEFIALNSIKGFLADDEGCALRDLAVQTKALGPCLEIGSYCGKSTVYIGSGCKAVGNTLYAVDHHRGSEEHQLGEEYHDASLFDAAHGRMNSFPEFNRAIAAATLTDTVVPVVASSMLTVRDWATPLGLVFIDGGHSHESAMHDCLSWSRHLVPDGYLAVHDLFEHPSDGGQGPYLAFQAVLNSGDFNFIKQVNSLGVLQRK